MISIYPHENKFRLLSLKTAQPVPITFPCVLEEDVAFSAYGEGGRQDHWVKLDAGTSLRIDPNAGWKVQASVDDGLLSDKERRFKYIGFGENAEFIDRNHPSW